MRNPTDIFLRCLVLIFGVVMLQATAHAQEARPATVAEEKKNPNAWEVRAYRYPAPPLMVGFDVIERGKLIAPPMSGRHASPEEIVAFLGRSHEVVSQHFRLESVLLPKGSLAAYDPDHQTLVIRTTNAVHNRIDALATSYMAVLPQYLAFSIRILEADGKVIRELVKECATKPVHLPALARLESLVAQGQAKHLGTLRVDTRSGQRATVKSVTDFHYLAEQTVDGRDLAATTQESREVGTIFQIDPIIAPDGLTIDSTIAVEHHHASPTMHWVASGQRGARAIESPTPDFHVAKVNTAITMLSGVTKLLGVWKPHNPAAEPPLDRLQIAFVKGDVVSIMPAPDNRLEGLVSAYGEKVEPTPKEPVPETTDTPPGMIRRSFRTPPSFLSVGMAPPVPSDPIGFPSPAWRDPRPTALEVLKAQGITFPPGAYANFNPSTCEMVVCNTPDNIALVEAYMSALMQTNVRVVVTTVDVVQADGATLRKVESETANTADHALAWGMLEKEITAGRATVLSSAWLETRSGQRAICEAVTEHLFSQGAEYARIPGGDGERDKTASVNNVTISTGGSLPLATQFDRKKVGMELELDPVIGPDGITVDLNLSFKYDHAPPTTRQDPLVADDKVFRFRPAGLEFHQADISTAVTLHSGQRRLLGIWRPTGTPEFEKADVLQAAFLRVDVVEMQYDDEKKP